MNKIKYLAVTLIAVAGLGLSQSASAARHSLPASPAHLLAPYTFFTNAPIGNPSDELNYLQTHGGGSYQPTFLPASSQFLGKFENSGSWSNDVTPINISQYVTVTMTDAETWHVEWHLGGSGFTMDGMLIKDGRIQGSGEVYKFYGVSADEKINGEGDVSLADVGQNGRQISHITFFGSPGGTVPDGGTTVMLLGAALSSLGMARRFLKK
jgi:protein with PEP-CTERM/exosortase system signal